MAFYTVKGTGKQPYMPAHGGFVPRLSPQLYNKGRKSAAKSRQGPGQN
jgi:hypothetical protein